VNDYRNQNSRNPQHPSDLLIAEPFEEAQSEYLRRLRRQPSQRASQCGFKLTGIGISRARGDIHQFERVIVPPGSNEIERGIHRRSSQIALLTVHGILTFATKQAQKDRLQNVFCVRCVAGDPVRRAEDERVMILENARQFASQANFAFLDECGLQGSLPLSFSPVKTEGSSDYYKDFWVGIAAGGND
jgi:hypothetical protein